MKGNEVKEMTKMLGVPSVGRVVHYVLPDGNYPGEHRPAMIVKVWGNPRQFPFPAVQLAVFVDGSNDHANILVAGYEMTTLWRTSVRYSEENEPGTWHWPEFEPPLDLDDAAP